MLDLSRWKGHLNAPCQDVEMTGVMPEPLPTHRIGLGIPKCQIPEVSFPDKGKAKLPLSRPFENTQHKLEDAPVEQMILADAKCFK